MRDGTKLTTEQGVAIMKKFQELDTKDSIFSSFEFMDKREDLLRQTRDSDFYFISQFELMKKIASENPDLLVAPAHHKKNYNQGRSGGYSGGGGRRYYNGPPGRRPGPRTGGPGGPSGPGGPPKYQMGPPS
jgi:hypothetical protein